MFGMIDDGNFEPKAKPGTLRTRTNVRKRGKTRSSGLHAMLDRTKPSFFSVDQDEEHIMELATIYRNRALFYLLLMMASEISEILSSLWAALILCAQFYG